MSVPVNSPRGERDAGGPVAGRPAVRRPALTPRTPRFTERRAPPVSSVKEEDMSNSVQEARKVEGKARTRNIVLWVLQVILAVVFVMAGGSKLAGAKAMVDLFQEVGVGQWLRYVTGSLEVAGAILVLVPRLSALGGLALTGVMAGGFLTCLFVIDQSPAPTAVLLVLAAVVTWNRRALTLSTISRGGAPA
ncbi:DoxX family protein [Streptomyces sp. NPDC001068]|uniref:DoxX family protein n=1 Tax=Streptomyces sp. NPDC001068 TaxID=3364544 RepID=UPI00368A4CF1